MVKKRKIIENIKSNIDIKEIPANFTIRFWFFVFKFQNIYKNSIIIPSNINPEIAEINMLFKII